MIRFSSSDTFCSIFTQTLQFQKKSHLMEPILKLFSINLANVHFLLFFTKKLGSFGQNHLPKIP